MIDRIRLPQLLVGILALAGSLQSLAQVEFSAWPDRFPEIARPGVAAPGIQSLQMNCLPPEGTVRPGQTTGVLIDTFGATGFTIGEEPELRYGLAAVSNDSLQYEASATLGEGGFDTVALTTALADGGTRVDSFVFAAGRAGRRDSVSVTVDGGDTASVRLPLPPGELFCGSIEVCDDNEYEASDRRSATFAGGRVSDRLLYRAARTPGRERLCVVICNVLGTCDTVQVDVSVIGRTVELPFFDDFSYAGPRPDAGLWLEDDVYVNTAFGVRPPSIGVATFDGLDAGGRPYGDDQGETDRLTSTYIDLSSLDVTLPGYLKLYIQRGGRGLVPEDGQGDQFFIEARSEDGEWVELEVREGTPRPNDPDTAFSFLAYPLDDPIFFHDEFQVRFRTEGNRRGAFDVWNLDYVVVEQTNSAASAFPDIALSEPPPFLTRPYSALPYSQFAGRPELLREDYSVSIFNHFDRENNVSDARASVEDSGSDELVSVGLLTGSQFNLPAQSLSEYENTIPDAQLGTLRGRAGGLDESAASDLQLVYTLNVDAEQDRSIPGVLRNDTARTTTVIGDYYAYDDGTAEVGIAPRGVGTQIAVEYESFVADTLRGLRFSFPRLGPVDADRQLINLRVWIGTLDDTPDYEQVLVRPYYPTDQRDTLQALTTYSLVDSTGDASFLVIPPGPFFVGWQQASDANTSVPVGFDIATSSTDKIYTNPGVSWQPLDSLKPNVRGSVMLRPVFSRETLIDSSVPTRDQPVPSLTLAPNPTSGEVRWIGSDAEALVGARFEVYDATGRRLRAGVLRENSLRVSELPGLYVLRLTTRSGAESSFRVVVR